MREKLWFRISERLIGMGSRDLGMAFVYAAAITETHDVPAALAYLNETLA